MEGCFHGGRVCFSDGEVSFLSGRCPHRGASVLVGGVFEKSRRMGWGGGGRPTMGNPDLFHIAIQKDILSELNRCIFQISLKYIKLVIPKILFILVLCSFNFYFKIT